MIPIASGPAEQEILEYIRNNPSFTRADIEKNCAAGSWTRENFLRRLLHKNLVQKRGKDGLLDRYAWMVIAKPDTPEVNAVKTSEHVDGPPLNHNQAAAKSKSKLDRLISGMTDTQPEPFIAPAEKLSREEQHIWNFMAARPYFTKTDIAKICASPAIRNRLFKRLEATGVLRIWATSDGMTTYCVRSREEILHNAKSKRDTAEGIIWTAIRRQKRFRPIDLYAAIAPARPDILKDTVLAYCRMLRLAGYVRCAPKTPTLNDDTVLTLVNNTGPLPPIKKRTTIIIDSNDDQIVYAAGGRL